MYLFVTLIYLAGMSDPQVSTKPFDKLNDCEVAAHTFMVSPGTWPKGVVSVAAGCKMDVKH
jgi:hypothetical protein